MDISKRLQEYINIYNDLVEEEHNAEKTLIEIRDRRTQQLGKVQVMRELQEEELKEASLAAAREDEVAVEDAA